VPQLPLGDTRQIGRWLFGAVGVLGWAVAIIAISALVLPYGTAESALNLASTSFPMVTIGCVGTTWLGNLSRLRQRH